MEVLFHLGKTPMYPLANSLWIDLITYLIGEMLSELHDLDGVIWWRSPPPDPAFYWGGTLGTTINDVHNDSNSSFSPLVAKASHALCIYWQFGHETIPNLWIQKWKSSQLGKHGFGSLHKVAWTCCHNGVDTDFFSQVKLTKLPLINCFVSTF